MTDETTAGIPGGIVPPVVAPLTTDGEVDAASLERVVARMLDAGVHGVFALGTTGETAFLTDAQRDRVTETVVGTVSGAVPVLVGAIDSATARVVERVGRAEALGAQAVVVTAPFYTRTDAAEIDRHFRIVAGRASVPVVAYDIPAAVHARLATETVLGLAADGVIAGVKDTSGDDAGQRVLVLEARRRGIPLTVLTGSELTVDAAVALGADGAVPGLANVDPAGYVRLWDALAAGDLAAAVAEQTRLAGLFRLTTAGDPATTSPSASALGGYTAALHALGVIETPRVPDPCAPLDDAAVTRVRDVLAEAGLL